MWPIEFLFKRQCPGQKRLSPIRVRYRDRYRDRVRYRDRYKAEFNNFALILRTNHIR